MRCGPDVTWLGSLSVTTLSRVIRVLGGVEISAPTAHGDPLPPGLERKARELLTIFVLHMPTALGVGELVRLLWDDPPVSALRTLRSHISRVRSATAVLGHADAVVSLRGDSYRLAGDIETDVAEVARLRIQARRSAAEGRQDDAARALAEARQWWRGAPVLPDTLAGQALQAGWERERRLLVMEHLEAVVRGTRPADALGELARLTADEPLYEPAWVQFVTGLHRVGLQTDALAAVARARWTLSEVGLDPGPDLEAAQASVLAGPRAPGPIRPEGGPTPTGDRVRYTRSGSTAYTELTGTGVDDDAPTLLVLNPAMVTIDGLLDESHVRAVLARLSDQVHLFCLERRGIGLSAPLATGTDPLELWVQDVAAVIDHAALRRPVLLANFDTGLIAIEYAAHHPGALAGLVLINCYPTYQRGRGYPHGLDPQTTAELIAAAVDPSRDRPLDTSVIVAPSLAAEAEFRAWWNRIGRRGANPTTARIVREVATTADLRDRLRSVACPTLVVARRQCTNVDPAHSSYLAEHLPQARLQLIDGTDAVWFTDEDIVDVVIPFATAATAAYAGS